ncbi:MAG: alpha-amylase family glycosyl hydrolase [Gemmataceae bacterium]
MDLDTLADRLARAAVQLAEQRRCVPVATYRLQMNAHFTFADATRLVPYLAKLGVSHLYLSPVLSARPGSSHGYDVTDPSQLNPELGTEADFQTLAETAQRHGLGLLLDVVPNHMYLGSANPWWRDIFEHGPSSPYAGYFDIAWDDPPRAELRGRLLLPLLARPTEGVAVRRAGARLRGRPVCHPLLQSRIAGRPADLRARDAAADAGEADRRRRRVVGGGAGAAKHRDCGQSTCPIGAKADPAGPRGASGSRSSSGGWRPGRRPPGPAKAALDEAVAGFAGCRRCPAASAGWRSCSTNRRTTCASGASPPTR